MFDGSPVIIKMLNISNSVWVLCTPNAGQNTLFQCFLHYQVAKRNKKLYICGKIQQKTVFNQRFGANT